MCLGVGARKNNLTRAKNVASLNCDSKHHYLIQLKSWADSTDI